MGKTNKKLKQKHDAGIYYEEFLIKKCSSFYNKVIKRVVDFFIAVFLFILLLPFLVLVSVLIVVDSGFPVFYRADRGGYNNKTFKIYKFRTMVRDADKIGGGTTALNDTRITKIGHFLRKTKMDEIPQLINILKGEMSFIGPRPELLRYAKQYEKTEKYILKVRPGITDFSSLEFISLDEIVGGENADEMYEKYVLKKKNNLRVRYVAEQSIWVDCKLFFLTVFNVLIKIKKTVLN